MLDILASNTVLVVFIVVALGAAFGAIPFGPLKFGAAGALFIGLLVGAVVPPSTSLLVLLQDLGLGIFVYMIGLEAGETFFQEIRKQLGLMLASVIAITAGAAAAVGLGELLGLLRGTAVGVFAGSLTSTPSLALAQEMTDPGNPAVGYSIGYPVGVTLAIVMVAIFINREWKARHDQLDPDDVELEQATVYVDREISAQQMRDIAGQQVRFVAMRRNRRWHILDMERALEPGDRVRIFASRAALSEAIERLGSRMRHRRLTDPYLAVHRFTVSNRDIAGLTVGSLPLYRRFEARVTVIRRADDEILATPDTYLEMGDVVEVALPTSRVEELEEYFGDSVSSSSELDWVAAAGGLALGFALGLVEIPLPGGAAFSLGAAGGPLVVGLILGAVHRTGRVPWQLPRPANLTLRQFGLMLFLAAVGLNSGSAFASTVFTMVGLKSLLLAAAVSIVGCGVMMAAAWALGSSATRSSGAVAGLLGQPAVLSYATSRTTDNRVMTGYATTFAIALIYKIVVVPFMF